MENKSIWGRVIPGATEPPKSTLPSQTNLDAGRAQSFIPAWHGRYINQEVFAPTATTWPRLSSRWDLERFENPARRHKARCGHSGHGSVSGLGMLKRLCKTFNLPAAVMGGLAWRRCPCPPAVQPGLSSSERSFKVNRAGEMGCGPALTPARPHFFLNCNSKSN